MYLADQTWPELGDYFAEESLAVVPIGSTEQHGPHLPLATDHLIAEALAREAADRTGYLCTPTVNVGVSPHHKQFHGTMWVDPPAFRDYVESLSRNLTYHGIDRIVYVNAHGGNMAHLREVGRRLRESYTAVRGNADREDDTAVRGNADHEDDTGARNGGGDEAAFAVEWMWDQSIPDLVDDLFEHNGPHGGPKETAMIQHIAGDLVREGRLDEARDGGVTEFDEANPYVHGARNFYDAIDNTDNGVLGDQTDATAEKGAELFEAATEQLVELLGWIDTRPFEDLMAKPHVDPQPGSRR